MADKEELQKMLDSLVDDNSEQAQTHFHSFLADRMKEVLGKDKEPTVNDEEQND